VRLRLITLIAALWAFCPAVSYANAVLYTVSVDYSGLEGLPAGSTLNWSLEVPSVISASTDITTILSSALGPGFGICGAVTSSQISPTSLTGVSGGGLPGPFVGDTVASWATPCGPGNMYSGAAQFYKVPFNSLGFYTAYNSPAGGADAIGTLTIAAELNLQGGPGTSPTLLDVPLVAVVTGTIGAQGTEDYYTFLWGGGPFSATGSITGPTNNGASYSFSEGDTCGSGGATLDGTDSFTATITIPNLAAGQYCIGIDANNVNDPTFAINFNTPVGGVPEPSAFVLLAAGLGIIGLLRLGKAHGIRSAPPRLPSGVSRRFRQHDTSTRMSTRHAWTRAPQGIETTKE
jgi:hypothetical protein